jgi:uncharacterized alpha-E superfamily protein
MICRVAESCFWMHRYLERADSMARLLEVNLAFILDAPDGATLDGESWLPILVVAGEGPSFIARHGTEGARDGELVQRYLVWDSACPVSIYTSVQWARENARTIRESISLDMWEALNGSWLWLSGPEGKRQYKKSRRDFYVRVKESAQMVRGVARDTIAHDEAFEFMRLGLMLERANQTARLLDVWHHTMAGEATDAVAFAQAVAVLRSCSGTETFMKRGEVPTGGRVARFLVLDADFPRAVKHCLAEAAHMLERLAQRSQRKGELESPALLSALLAHLHSPATRAALDDALHDALTTLVDAITALFEAIHRDFFDVAS